MEKKLNFSLNLVFIVITKTRFRFHLVVLRAELNVFRRYLWLCVFVFPMCGYMSCKGDRPRSFR